jgi:hypothetical protein
VHTHYLTNCSVVSRVNRVTLHLAFSVAFVSKLWASTFLLFYFHFAEYFFFYNLQTRKHKEPHTRNFFYFSGGWRRRRNSFLEVNDGPFSLVCQWVVTLSFFLPRLTWFDLWGSSGKFLTSLTNSHTHTHIRGIETHTGIYRGGSTFSLLSKGGVDSLKKYKRNDKVWPESVLQKLYKSTTRHTISQLCV